MPLYFPKLEKLFHTSTLFQYYRPAKTVARERCNFTFPNYCTEKTYEVKDLWFFKFLRQISILRFLLGTNIYIKFVGTLNRHQIFSLSAI